MILEIKISFAGSRLLKVISFTAFQLMWVLKVYIYFGKKISSVVTVTDF